MAKKKNRMKINLKIEERWEGQSIRRVGKKWSEGRWTRLQERENIHDSDNYEVQETQTICVSIVTRPK